MSVLTIRLFGRMQLAHAGKPWECNATHTTQILLAYLLLNRERLHSREVLAGLLWAEQPQKSARRCFNTALWRLRRLLEPDGVRGSYLIVTNGGMVGFNPDGDYWLDLAEFERGVSAASQRPPLDMSADEVETLCATLELYQGDLLEALYADWVLSERERLRSLYLTGLAHLFQHYSQRNCLEEAVQYGGRILALDPIREDIHRELMLLYARNGQRGRALRQYDACRAALHSEQAVEPSPETRAVYRQLSTKTATQPIAQVVVPSTTNPTSSTTYNDAVSLLQVAIQQFNGAQEQLRNAMHLVEILRGRKE